MRRSLALVVALTTILGCASTGAQQGAAGRSSERRRVVVFVWDGLRPDSISTTDTPHLAALRAAGVEFADNHATYPTFTMMNSASLATGAFPGKTGFYGNWLWEPGATGSDFAGKPVDFRQPVFTEDYAILQALDRYYDGRLLLVGTLFEAAQSKKLTTAAIGKTGAAFLLDRKKGGFIIDEKLVWPLSLAKELQAAGQPLPATTPNAYPAGTVTLSAGNGNPTAFASKVTLADGATTDPTSAAAATSPYASANAYMMKMYLDHVLPKRPDVSFIWFRSPDTNEHVYGPGSANYRDALRAQDGLLGDLQAKLTDLGMASTTDIVIVSDHGHSNVSGPLSLFPLRAIAGDDVSGADAANGWSVSGDVRLADLLAHAGFTAYDGAGCVYSPVLSGIKADGSRVYPTRVDGDGTACGKAGAKYTTSSFKVPPQIAPHGIVVAANGGSEYLYVPDHDPATVTAAAAFLQTREEYGAVFVAGRYGAIPGTHPLEAVRLENVEGRSPDLIASFAFDESATIAGVAGTTFESMQNNRGMHGGFSPIDVHNTLLAAGPDFKRGMRDVLPSGNVDVAPTVALILGLQLPDADGRPLQEALVDGGLDPSAFTASEAEISLPAAANGLVMKLPTSPSGADVDASRTSYSVRLHTKKLAVGGKSYTYFDWAKAIRQ